MLQSALDEIIEYYEAEKNNLQYLIEECVKEREYGMANSHFQAFRQANGRLQTLYNLRDPLYESRSHLEHMKEMLEKDKMMAHEGFKIYYEKEIEERQNRIEKLSNEQKLALDRQDLHDLIDDLIQGKIKAFKLHLIKKEQLFIEFRRLSDSIIISMTPFAELAEFTILTHHVRAFSAAGFVENKNTGRLEKNYPILPAPNVINSLVAKILFEIFYFKLFDKPAIIEIESMEDSSFKTEFHAKPEK